MQYPNDFFVWRYRPGHAKHQPMGYLVKMQKVDRPTNRSFYLNFPVVLAQALAIKKGEKFEWLLEDKNTLILHRLRHRQLRKFNKTRHPSAK